MNTITITANEYGARTPHVEVYEAASRVAAGGAYRSEAELLLAFVAAEGVPKSITDQDGDVWNLCDRVDGDDEYTYEMVETTPA